MAADHDESAALGFRAQVRSNDGSVWVNGGLFTKRKNAEADAQRLVEQYGNEVRVIEEEAWWL